MNETNRHLFQSATGRKNTFITISIYLLYSLFYVKIFT